MVSENLERIFKEFNIWVNDSGVMLTEQKN